MARPTTLKLLARHSKASKRAEQVYASCLGEDHLQKLQLLLIDGAAVIPNFRRLISKIAEGASAKLLLEKIPREPMGVLERRSMPYSDFLETEYWANVRPDVFRSKGKKCTNCGSKTRIQVHHATYEHRGDELNHLSDLIPLCKPCHTNLHNK